MAVNCLQYNSVSIPKIRLNRFGHTVAASQCLAQRRLRLLEGSHISGRLLMKSFDEEDFSEVVIIQCAIVSLVF